MKTIWILVTQTTRTCGHGDYSISIELATSPGSFGETIRKAFRTREEAIDYADALGLFRAEPMEFTL